LDPYGGKIDSVRRKKWFRTEEKFTPYGGKIDPCGEYIICRDRKSILAQQPDKSDAFKEDSLVDMADNDTDTHLATIFARGDVE